jgi:hypothetical protein
VSEIPSPMSSNLFDLFSSILVQLMFYLNDVSHSKSGIRSNCKGSGIFNDILHDIFNNIVNGLVIPQPWEFNKLGFAKVI